MTEIDSSKFGNEAENSGSSSLLDSFKVAPSIDKPKPTENGAKPSNGSDRGSEKRKRMIDFDVTEMTYEQYCDRHYAIQIERSGVLAGPPMPHDQMMFMGGGGGGRGGGRGRGGRGGR